MILVKRLTEGVSIDKRLKGFQPIDGCAENTFILDQILRQLRQNYKQAFIVSIDVTKAFDRVIHKTIIDSIEYYNVPEVLREYKIYL